jgi:hypothetical protein
MEEDLGAQEALVSHVHRELVLGDGVHARVLLDVLSRLRVVLVELLGNVRAHVAVPAHKSATSNTNTKKPFRTFSGYQVRYFCQLKRPQMPIKFRCG